MARKSPALLASKDRIEEAVDKFKSTSQLKYELARAAYLHQDDDTRDMIEQLVKVLNVHATGYITVQLAPPAGAVIPVKIEQRFVDYNTLYIVMDMLGTLALFDIRVGKYTFPPSHCAQCKAEIIPERRHA